MLSHKQACEAWNAVFDSVKQFRLSALFMSLPTNLRVINANPELEADKKRAAAFLREWADSISSDKLTPEEKKPNPESDGFTSGFYVRRTINGEFNRCDRSEATHHVDSFIEPLENKAGDLHRASSEIIS